MLNITQAVTRSARGVFNYEGRSRRSECWWTALFWGAVIVALGLVEEIFFPKISSFDAAVYFGNSGWEAWLLNWRYHPASTLLYYITLPIFLALMARRMHDVGRSAWIGTIPIISFEMLNFIPEPSYMDWVQKEADLAPMNILYFALIFGGSVLGLYSFALGLLDSEKANNKYGPSQKYP